RAIFRRAALDDVTDVNVFALQAHGFDHLREELSGAPDKGKALGIFIRARSLSDKNKLGFGISVAENDGVAMLMKLAARTFAQVLANPKERVVHDFVGRIEK